MKRVAGATLAAACALALLALLATSAGAVVVQGPSGHRVGVTPQRGVSNAHVAGALVEAQASSASHASSGQLVYNGGAVLHSSAPYLIFWTPNGESIPGPTQSLLERYFTDVAADSGLATNVYGVDRQFTDGSGFADYRQTFSASSQVITDTDPYPTADTTNCPYTAPSYPTCITDTQLQAEVARVVSAKHLPSDGASPDSPPANAPIYFVVLPTDVNVCTSSNACAGGSSGGFCAYHGATTTGTAQLLYASIPTLITGPGQNPKACQWDNNSAVQEPNGSLADVVIKYMSHEDNESITDPFLDAWYSASGQEDGDECNFYGSSVDPANDFNPNAFLPVLGGAASAGTLYDQLINGNQYYIQSEWSNGDGNCEMQPTSGVVTPQITASSTSAAPGTALSFSAPASTSTYPYSSATWDFGDGTTQFVNSSNPTGAISHTYTTAGHYTVKLTLVDNRGNLASTSQQIAIGAARASFAVTTAQPGSGQPISFDASASSVPGGSISGYAWNFGDGTTGTGVTPQHTYQHPGNYTVTLTITSTGGQAASTSQTINVAGPTASIAATDQSVEGQAINFDASGSTPGPGSTLSYAWNFGDNSPTATGATTQHAYTEYGTYTATLTVTNDLGQSDTATYTVAVSALAPTAALSVSPASGSVIVGQPVAFNALASSDPYDAITSYTWSFGDGATATGATASHSYSHPGSYWVWLTVTNRAGLSAIAAHAVNVTAPPPVASFGVATARPASGQPVTFDGSASHQADGSVAAYNWNFGDGTSGSGTRPTHVYAKPGSYHVTLTVVAGDGQVATTAQTVVVALAGRVTKIALRPAASGAQLLVSVNGPGRLLIGTTTHVAHAAGTVTASVKLTRQQLAHIAHTGPTVKVRVPITFTPVYGPAHSQTVTITFRHRNGSRDPASTLTT